MTSTPRDMPFRLRHRQALSAGVGALRVATIKGRRHASRWRFRLGNLWTLQACNPAGQYHRSAHHSGLPVVDLVWRFRASRVDDGLTFGTNHDGGVCIHFDEKVPSPLRRSGHSALTVTVADLEGLTIALGGE